LLTEQREALEQQTATAEVLGIINSSLGDLAPVFEAILERAHRLCGAFKGGLDTFDGEGFRTTATRGLSQAVVQILREPQRYYARGSVRAELLNGADLVFLTDPASLPAPLGQALAEVEGIRSILFVPLRLGSSLLGYITAYRMDTLAFSDKQIALLKNFAAQASIAIENARLLNQQREALEQQTATSEVLQVINASPGNLAPVFDAILEKAHTLCGAAMGSLVLFDGTHFRAAATLGYTEEYDAVVRQAQLPTIRTQALIGGERFAHVLDMQKVESELDHSVVARSRLSSTGIRTALWMPLRNDNKFLGFISAYRRKVQAFSEKEIA